MARKGEGKPLKLGEDLPPHELARLTRKMLEHREHVLANQEEHPDPSDATVAYTETPAAYTHPTVRRVRRLPKSRLRGAQLPKQNN